MSDEHEQESSGSTTAPSDIEAGRTSETRDDSSSPTSTAQSSDQVTQNPDAGRTFVYPIKSLLSRDIQPASKSDAEGAQSAVRPRLLGRLSTESSTTFSRHELDFQSERSPTTAAKTSSQADDMASIPALIRSSSSRAPPSVKTAGPLTPDPTHGHESSASSAPPSSSNSTLPSIDETLAPTAFSMSTSAAAALTQVVRDSATGPLSLPIPSMDSSRPSSPLNSGPPSSDYFTTPEMDGIETAPSDTDKASETQEPESEPEPEPEPFNISLTDIVRLGPLGDRESMQSRGRSMQSRRSMEGAERSTDMSNDTRASSLSQPQSPSDPEDELLVTQRFSSMTDEDGHHVMAGREGVLTRCEDEPIRTPGAVQGYGVLIAIEEDQDAGTFTVRQVSENSTSILGLSPRYLFSLECFTECLPDREQETFFDNIQFLNSPHTQRDAGDQEEDSTHVFVLSGWGEPGTASASDPDAGPEDRRSWSCWCAAHRPRPVTSSVGDGPSVTSDVSNTIILEFELERDAQNPLYPTPSGSEFYRSGTQSPASATGSAWTGTNLSGQTLVSAPGFGSLPSDVASPPLPDHSSQHEQSIVTASSTLSSNSEEAVRLPGEDDWHPTSEHILESTTNRARPLPALERLRQLNRGLATDSRASTPASRGSSSRRRPGNRRPAPPPGVGMMDIFAVMSQINEQLGSAPDLDAFMKIVVGVIKDLTQFHRVLVYQFDESWNGQVVAELVDWHRSHDLYMGLHFPASDIPAQARELYAINKVRLLYDRDLPTARLVARSKEDLDPPLNQTQCYLRAMSPIHLKYLGNMGVRASMSISIMGFGALWGLIACHSYGSKGMRVSFPVRQMLRLLSQSISRNIERLSYAHRLHTRKLINTVTSESHPGGYIVSNADDLLSLFDADYGMLVIGEGAKILGPNLHGQEILVVAEYLRLKQFSTMQVSQAVTIDYPDLKLSTGLEIIAGLLYVPLSSGGRDFIAFLRKGQPREVHWAGRPFKQTHSDKPSLEPRVSFKAWSQVVAGRARVWTDEQLETAGVLALVYGKFIEVWRQKETALQSTKLTNLLLSNASHEVRTPLNHIINYLELALNGALDGETRDNLQMSYSASKSLLFTINDLLDLTRLESGNELAFNEPFDLREAITDAIKLYRVEAGRRELTFDLLLSECPQRVVGDCKKIQTVVANLTGNALKYTQAGSISVEARAFDEPHGLRGEDGIAVEIVVADTGCGISSVKLESIFREFEQVEFMGHAQEVNDGVGLGLAVVAHIVEQLGGQLRVDSKVGEGSRFSFLIPFAVSQGSRSSQSPSSSLLARSRTNSAPSSARSARSELDSFVQALSASHLDPDSSPPQRISSAERLAIGNTPARTDQRGYFDVTGSSTPIRPVKMDGDNLDEAVTRGHTRQNPSSSPSHHGAQPSAGPSSRRERPKAKTKLRILSVEDDDVNRMLLTKRLQLQGHEVVNTTNGQECVNLVETDQDFDCILMDVQMPILNGFQATERVRELEREGKLPEGTPRASHELNGRIPIFVVSASLKEDQKDRMTDLGLDGWVLKPVDFKRLAILLEGITDPAQRAQEIYSTSRDWERGGWLTRPKKAARDFATEPDIPATPSEPAAPSQSAAPSSHEGSS